MKLTQSVLFNLLGKGVLALSTLIALPFYVRLLGAEAYGIAGLFTTLFLITTVFDLGLGSALNRELASGLNKSNFSPLDAVVTVEWLYWGLSFGIAVLFFLLAKPAALYWFNLESLSVIQVERAFTLMGIAIALYWPYVLYSNGLMGLHAQVECNIILIVMTLARCIGSVVALSKIAPTLEVFFLWQAVSFLVQSLWSRWKLRQLLHRFGKGRFKKEVLNKIRRFSVGVGGNTITAILIVHLDKIILSRMLGLSIYGEYLLLSTIASGLVSLGQPIAAVFFPRLTYLVETKRRTKLRSTFINGCILVGVIVLPLAGILAFFPAEILSIFFQKRIFILSQGSMILSYLSLAYGLNAVITIPYYLQLSYGWTRFELIKIACDAILFVPILLYLTFRFGALGAAISFLMLNMGNCFVGMHFMFNKILRCERWQWYAKCVITPSLVVCSVLTLGKVIGRHTSYHPIIKMGLCYVLVVAVLLAIYGPGLRNFLNSLKDSQHAKRAA